MNSSGVRVGVLGLALVGALLMPAEAATVRVRAFGEPGTFHWHPGVRRIVVNDRVSWVNETGANHTVTSYRGAWKKNATIEPGASTTFTFKATGTYKYRCTIHSKIVDGVCEGMCGTVRARPPQ